MNRLAKTDADPGKRRAGMSAGRLAVVLILLTLIAAFEYDWLTTPWWVLATRLCGSTGITQLVEDMGGLLRHFF
jgi:hypothetical protein